MVSVAGVGCRGGERGEGKGEGGRGKGGERRGKGEGREEREERSGRVCLSSLPSPFSLLPSSPARHHILHVLPICLALFTFAVLSGCAGYQIGNRSLYPAHIRTVYVPVFHSNSFRRGLGERLTEAVAKEIELKTPYKVTGAPGADSVLSGEIVGETKRVVVGSRSGEPRELQVNLAVRVSWIDPRGNYIRQAQSIALPAELVDVGGSGNIVPQVGQSVATGHQEAVAHLAEQIVALMEAPW